MNKVTTLKISPSPCCCPSKGPGPAALIVKQSRGTDITRNTVTISEGTALVGTNSPALKQDAEGPLRRKKIKKFACEKGAVTNAEFGKFVEDTGYKTEAERLGWSFVFFSHIAPELGLTRGVVGTEWWRSVDGANWRMPNGSDTASATPDHPVVQVSWNDATAYANWAGGRLPTETEWEHAARGGLEDVKYPWGDREPNDTNFFPCNIWQGQFPKDNLGKDGYKTTAPSISFDPNGYGLFNMVGNVWEWTRDLFTTSTVSPRTRKADHFAEPRKLLKGGSFLCHASYCTRYRIAARVGNTPDSASTHTGFRVIYAAN